MKQAVIEAGGKQYIVHKDQELNVELVTDKKQTVFKPLLVFDDKNVKVGTPYVEGSTVTAEVLEEGKADKVIAIRFKAKKRVSKRRGHRQRFNRIKITDVK